MKRSHSSRAPTSLRKYIDEHPWLRQTFDRLLKHDGGTEAVIARFGNCIRSDYPPHILIRRILLRLAKLHDLEPGSELSSRLAFSITKRGSQQLLDSKHCSGIGSDSSDIVTVDNLTKLFIVPRPYCIFKNGNKRLFERGDNADLIQLYREGKLFDDIAYFFNCKKRHRSLLNLLSVHDAYVRADAVPTIWSIFFLPRNNLYPSPITRWGKACDPLKSIIFENTIQGIQLLLKKENGEHHGSLKEAMLSNACGQRCHHGTFSNEFRLSISSDIGS